jgi:ubiquitin C-terminal hydrolase
VLIVHLKRFKVDCNGNVSGKNEANVLFPLENLDLSLFSGDSMHSIKYSLSGVSMHRGTLVNGHYTSFCKSTVDGSWRYYDDTKVRTVTDAEIQTGDAYVLYYSAFTENLHRVAK